MPKRKKKKKNPNKIPCSQADVNRAKEICKAESVRLAFAIPGILEKVRRLKNDDV